ncbi:uncharacterized protein LOC131168763 [Hevea brasiliensis]|uniref:uncharacterized protein LOC131168763 n=1 Tax=Hevea brasiliensis TaxID=3981 RepID=UPI0025EB61C6|nr:uncharacterized protein LOC131168763 [Hevea brasiliensis]
MQFRRARAAEEEMEKAEKSKKRCGKRKISKSETSSIVMDNADTIFALMLAALCNHGNGPNSQSLLKTYLNQLYAFLFSKSLNSIPLSILALFPVLLSSKCPDIACRSAKIVGATSLLSLEMNERIALDSEIVKVLILALGSSSRKVSVAACNALLDLSTTTVGTLRLLEFSALEKLMIKFLQVRFSSTLIFLCNEDNRSVACVKIAFKEDTHILSILHAAISLINTCNLERLEKVPRNLSETFLAFLKRLWTKVHSQMLLGNPLIFIPERKLCISNITINNLAESIFRLSSSVNQFAPLPSLLVKRRIFGLSEDSFETFMLRDWEVSPFIVRRPSTSLVEDDIFSSFTKSLNYKESSYSFISSMLQSFISCLPIGSDELDILNFLEEVRNELGCPIIYQQDLRVLRTEKQSKREMHFFPENLDPCCIMTPNFFSIDDIMKCEEACKEGYTIAIRGMEFRFASIAAVADTLASLFGQPSVGANMYVTPPNSQGLACHCDDHCVFVCQLFGNKQWTVFSQPNYQLPRLYDPLDSQQYLDGENSFSVCRKFFLREGDVLYVPRGFAHEACTDDSVSGELARFSVHITFGIEVEPRFEWAGFAHVALQRWNQNKKKPDPALVEPSSGLFNVITVNLLHAMIELIGASDPTFRKACLVGALSLPLDRRDWLYCNQKTIFNYLINKINLESWFLEALRMVEVAIEKKDLFQGMRWLHLLNNETETIQGHGWNTPLMEIENLFPAYIQHQDLAEAAFMQIKTKFCDEVSFEDVVDSYKMLFEKYKKARKQYVNGMLSLHCN